MITWIMVFSYFSIIMNQVLTTEIHGIETFDRCIKFLDEQFDKHGEQGVPTEYMTGWCYEIAPHTLKIKPGDDVGVGPVTLD